jgi:hypothetical protein
MRKLLISMHLITLTIGSFIYLFFRSDTLLMFRWFDSISLTDKLETLRNYTLPLGKNLPNWFIYSLPDGLWISSYVFLMFSIWGESLSSKSIIWLLLILIAAIVSEFCQLIHIIPGTFDMLDLLSYTIGFSLTAFLIIKYNKLKNLQYEK